MEYITAAEAAEKWGVALRQVQRLLNENRIQGAKKYHRSWLVPEDAARPSDSRKVREKRQEKKTPPQNTISAGLEHINEISTTWPPLPWADPDAFAAAIPDEPYRPYRLYVEGGLAYLRGDFERTIQNFREIETKR
jgi:hypothetical protein